MRELRRGIRLIDALVIISVAVVTYNFMPHGFAIFDVEFDSNLQIALSLPAQSTVEVASWLIALQLARSYESRHWLNPLFEYPALLRATVINIALVAVFSFTFKVDFSRGMLLTNAILGAIGLIIGRQLLQFAYRRSNRLRKSLHGRRIALVIGKGAAPQDALQRIQDNEFSSIDAVGSFDISMRDSCELVDEIKRLKIGYVLLVGSSKMSPSEFRKISQLIESTTAELFVMSAVPDLGLGRIEPYELAGQAGFFVTKPRFRGPQLLLKRLMDIVASLLFILIFTLPLLVFVLFIKREDGGPIFFRQERVGRDGKPFQMLKFRSMRVGADDQHESLKQTKSRKATNHVMFKDPQDERVTCIGRIMRRWSIDETPQFWNVLKGEMSVVGPRPPLASEVKDYEEDAMRRFKVKPGITGLWQVSGRASLNWEQTLKLDLYYVENWSPALDIYLMLRTIKAVFSQKGAY